MDVFNVSDEIAIISDLVLPVPPLPDCLLTFMKMRCRLLPLELILALPAEMTLDLPPSHGEVTIIFRQSPYAMQLIWQ